MTTVRRWPLFLIAAPAAIAIWSGWVGLGGLAGFGLVHPLPGIVPGLQLNTAITLPIGVEAYGAYALGAWLTPDGVPAAARTFARRSAIGALLLGMAGQVIYHLLAAAHATRAPWPVVMAVACMPVVSLGFGAALSHLLRTGPEPVQAAAEAGLTAAPVLAARTDAPEENRTDAPLAEVPPAPAVDLIADGQGAAAVPVDRDQVVAELADQMRDAIAAGDIWRPDYDALMARTGFRRSWCEKAVRDARQAQLEPPPDRAGDSRTGTSAPRTDTAGDEPGEARTGELALANGQVH